MSFRPEDIQYLLDSHGKACVLVDKTLGTYSVSTGGLTGGSVTSSTALMHFSDYNDRDFDGAGVVLGDRKVLIPIVTTSGTVMPQPNVGDEITGDGDAVSIVRVQRIMSGASAVCYICQVRG